MDAIFGETRQSDTFSEGNGLPMHTRLEEAFDKDVLRKDREYRMKILDPEWNKLDTPVALGLKIFRELDGTKLEFSNPNNPKVMHRPAARYLYFHYCMQVLQKAWQSRAQGRPQGATAMLKAENGSFSWGTKGRYPPRNMLLAFVEELRHEYEDLLEGSSCVNSNEKNMLLAVAVMLFHSRDLV
ncbi:unnamed protein product [Penicillium salamii]|uniref:Uncharacterized protein n=1 Tax=Penicillium salamii TaxID=1612424 RepID=A0A9W4NWX3_9EURO|nr:unnamed protein product [Penicillium salamii]CAG8027839.1 unnamed protein product [Penicillium salamii]CAG8062829.1 unnamed protein product [Penicillium salamii]CAG8080240.1 unnamed protein product [Penicillium salamii]CAG8187283.1 unnamed protein product [Penicillium salamii]